jgi:hypothetical protein
VTRKIWRNSEGNPQCACRSPGSSASSVRPEICARRLENPDNGLDFVRAEVVDFKKRACNPGKKIRPGEDVF